MCDTDRDTDIHTTYIGKPHGICGVKTSSSVRSELRRFLKYRMRNTHPMKRERERKGENDTI